MPNDSFADACWLMVSLSILQQRKRERCRVCVQSARRYLLSMALKPQAEAGIGVTL